MIAPRWRKVARDLWTERGRAALMTTAMALSLANVGGVLGAYAILTREMPRNYLGTRPASAALEVNTGVDEVLVQGVRSRPGIAEAEAGEIVLARAKVAEDWIPLLLFVVDDFSQMRLNTFTSQSGAWPPPEGTMLIERSAVPMLKAVEGGSVVVKTPNGRPRIVPITGLVHDPGLAPAWQEREGYGYITRATLALLGERPILGELRVTFVDGAADIQAIEAQTNGLAQWLSANGHPVSQARVPRPGRHPHQTQMMGVLFLMLVFSGLALLLSAILVSTSTAAIMARQVREIGVMKTLGARTGQIATLYVALISTLGLVAVVVATPVGVEVAQRIATMSANLLNLELGSPRVPWWVFGIQVAAGVLVPLVAGAIPIARGARTTVREAIDLHGASQPAPARGWLLTLGRYVPVSRMTSLALRNTVRRRTRTALTLALLSAGGAMFMTALNVSRGWDRVVDQVYENRSYDVEIRLDAPEGIVGALSQLPGVQAVEIWGYSSTALSRADQIDIVRTYPDGSHGSLALVGAPPETKFVHFPLLAGRWLLPGDTDGVVLNHLASAQAPGLVVGDPITLSVAGRPTIWRVVGIVEEVGAPGQAYVTTPAFTRVAGTAGRVKLLRLSTGATSASTRAELIRAIEALLEREGANVEVVVPLSMLRTAMGEHVVVLIRMLLAMAALMAAVGMLGLTSTMGTNVLERTREIGVMKAIGATPRQVARVVVVEALFIGVVSWVLAAVLALPLTAAVGQTVGMLSFRVRLPLIVDPWAVSWWLVLVVVVALIATILPAIRAARLTVRGALGQV